VTTPVNPEIDQSVTPHADRSAEVRGPTGEVATSRRRARWTVLGAVVATVVVSLTAAVLPLLLGRDGEPAALVPATANEPSTSAAAVTTPAKAADLNRFAESLVAAPFEAHKARYEYTDIRAWEADTQAQFATGPVDTVTVSVQRIKHWTNTVDSGRSYAVDEAKGCPPETDDTWTAREAGPWDGPLSSDPDAVHRQLLGPPPNSGIDLFGQIGQLYGARIVPLETRRGILRMLARQPNITVHQGVPDQSGRIGIAVVTTLSPPFPPNRPLRKTLIFDPATGDLLASATTDAAAAGTPSPDVAPWQRKGFLSYTLFLHRAYTTDVRTPAPDCTTGQR
jgi:hypothetical protein